MNNKLKELIRSKQELKVKLINGNLDEDRYIVSKNNEKLIEELDKEINYLISIDKCLEDNGLVIDEWKSKGKE